MTPFQERCVARVRAYLAAHGIVATFSEVRGKTEDYLQAKITSRERHIEVFIYEDEAGVMTDGSAWRLCERWDFAGEDEMIERLVETIAKELALINPRPP